VFNNDIQSNDMYITMYLVFIFKQVYAVGDGANIDPQSSTYNIMMFIVVKFIN
jgi:hypothetical protein